jgi:ubiquinone/menaquinone biosynthesis C-methylase UbiE
VPETNDIIRLRKEYEDRAERLVGTNRYSYFNPSHLFMLQSRQRAVLQVLSKHNHAPLDNLSIIEIGCGGGGVLTEYLTWGASPTCLHGVDLLLDRLQHAHTIMQSVSLSCANGEYLPYQTASFDLALQYTAFSSILDDQVKKHLADEMLRVLKPGGMILWYDFWLNPTNRQTKGIRPVEIMQLFPNCRYDFQKITLAPPIARRIVPFSWGIAHFFESLKIFNTHYLAVIRSK